MNKIFSIMKYTTIDNMNLNKYHGKNKTVGTGRTIGNSLSLLGFVILIEIIVAAYTLGMYAGFKELNVEYIILPITMIISTIAVFISTLNKAQGVLFASKDYDLLMAMPIKPSTALIAKVIYLLGFNYLFTILITLPAAVIYFVTAGAGAMFFINYIVAVLFMPLLPILVASMLSFFVSYISTKFRRKNLITTVLTILLLIVVFYFSFNLSGYMNMLVENANAVDNIIATYYPPADYYKEMLINNNYIDMLKYVSINIVSFLIFIFLLSKLFTFINMKLKESPKSKKYEQKKLKVTKPVWALYKKELKRYLSSTIYITNTIFGPGILLISSIACLFLGNDILSAIKNEPMFMNNIAKMFNIAICFIAAMSNTTNVSFSIEGKNLWIVKSMPVKMKDIYLSKIMLSLTFIIPTILLTSSILGIVFNITVLDYFFLIVIPILYTLVTSLLGLVINLHFPKFDAKNDTVIVKQSTASFIGIFGGMIITFALSLLYFILSSYISFNIYGIILITLMIIAIIMLWSYLLKGGAKLYNKFNV